MAELSAYQKKQQVASLMKTLDKGQKGQLLEALLGEWAETLPKKGKEFGISGGDGKFVERLEWLQEHWGTAFETKGTTALRKMPLSGVLELLTLFTLKGADSKEKEMTFGALQDGSVLAEKVARTLEAMKQAQGPQVVITRAAYDHLQAIKRMWKAEGNASPETSSKILDELEGVLRSMPAVKSETDLERIESRKKG
jgi:hypothetical protein